jgi:hypothetical protein
VSCSWATRSTSRSSARSATTSISATTGSAPSRSPPRVVLRGDVGDAADVQQLGLPGAELVVFRSAGRQSQTLA